MHLKRCVLWDVELSILKGGKRTLRKRQVLIFTNNLKRRKHFIPALIPALQVDEEMPFGIPNEFQTVYLSG